MQHFILYKTTNLINNKEYIGIHQTENLNDGYLGSGLAFKRALKKYGKENFNREILEFCHSFEELIQKEKIYVNEEWINCDNNYNLKTGGQSTGILSQESKNKISETLKKKYANGEIIANTTAPYVATIDQKKQISETLKEKYKTIPHPSTGKIPWNKGKRNAQIAWNKGIKIGPMSDSEKEKRSKKLKERYKTSVHHRKGKPSWNSGIKGVQISKFKGIKLKQIECPYCNKLVDIGNGKRWHFDNCKMK